MQAKADRVLELNPDHPGVRRLAAGRCAGPGKRQKKYVRILHTQALMMADLPVENAGEYTELVCELMEVSRRGLQTLPNMRSAAARNGRRHFVCRS